MTEITPNTAKSKKIRPKQIEVMEQFWAYTLNTKHYKIRNKFSYNRI